MAKMLAIPKRTHGTEHEFGQLRPTADSRERADTSCSRYPTGRPEIWSRSWPNVLPNEAIKKLDETLTTLDEKLFSRVDGEMPQIKANAALAPMTRTRYHDPSASYSVGRALVDINRQGDGPASAQPPRLASRRRAA
jgi:hypothetical protein